MNSAQKKERVIEVCRQRAAKCNTPEKVLDGVINYLKPSIRLLPQSPIDNQEISIGVSRIGGLPDLPAGISWPRFTDLPDDGRWAPFAKYPMSFLVQIQLSEVAPYDEEGFLPASGMLYFFYVDAGKSFGLDGDICHVKFIESETADLRRVAPPDDLPADERFRGFRLIPDLEWTVPSPSDSGWDAYDEYGRPFNVTSFDDYLEILGFWSCLDEKACEVQGIPSGDMSIHRMLGHPQLIQSPGLGQGTVLLLQVDSDGFAERDGKPTGVPQTGMNWGDMGKLYFLQTEDGLKARQFEDTSVILEMH